MKQGTWQRSEEFPDDGEEKSQGNIYAAGSESSQLGLGLGDGGFQEECLREEKQNELDRFTDVFDLIEDQKFGGRVVNTYVER